jgi:iron complex transport system substrate-binding protein
MLLTACTTPTDSVESNQIENSSMETEPETETMVQEQASSTITIEHKLGTIEVPLNPTKVVTLDVAALDTLIALGVEDSIVGISSLIPAYLADAVSDTTIVGTMFEPDYEAIAGLMPEVIFISARSSSVYEDLAEIAPVVYLSYPGIDNPLIVDTVFGNVELLASIYQKEELASTLIAELQKNVEQTSESIAQLENRDALMLIATGKEINAYGPEESSRYGFVFNTFNFVSPVSQDQIDAEVNKHGKTISFEFIAEIDPNYIFVIDRGVVTASSDVLASDTLDNAFVNNTKAGQNAHIIYLSGEQWYLTVGGYTSLATIVSELASVIE